MSIEKKLEKKLRIEVEKLGGWCLKFWPISFAGFPDRIVLMPGGNVYFVELKDKGEKPTKLQQNRIDWLVSKGFEAGAINSEIGLTQFLNELGNA